MKIFSTLFICLCSLLVAACGFHARSKAHFPKTLHTLYLAPEKPYSQLTTKLTALLKAMDVRLVNSPQSAQFSLTTSQDHFSSSHAEVVNANLPTTINYSQTSVISIKDNATQKVIASQPFNAKMSLTLNANQIYTPTTNTELRNTLNQDIVSRVYYWLISANIKSLLNHAAKHKSA